MSNPYGGSGSIVVPPRQVRGTSTRLGSRGWRLTNTTHGKATRRVRTATASAGDRILPTLSDEEAELIMARIHGIIDREVRVSAMLKNNNIHDK
jgi:hypothetical protein